MIHPRPSLARHAELLRRALGLPPSARRELTRRLRALGGLLGLVNAGAEALDGALPAPRLRRLERLLDLVSALGEPPSSRPRIDGAEAVVRYFRPRLRALRVETFWILMLDARGRAVGHAQVAEGILTACLVHPREVFAPAIRARAAQIVLVHNHPSGDPSPSDEDLALTERLVEAGELLGIPVVDHVVVAAAGHRSLGGAGVVGAPQRAVSRWPRGALEVAARPDDRLR